ncbi:MAG: DUF1501 domain-containing protein [Saprospiraceae bacterium]|nr:DUF1501 domain-containing protein [Saprospiraceae bacterium]
MGHHHHKIKRRTFLGQASCAAVGLTTLFSTVLNLKAMNAAASLNFPNLAPVGPFDDYKAMVCLLLAGGSDSYNMLIPTGTSDYEEYSTVRSNQAIPQNEIININPLNTPGKTFGVNPNMPNMAAMFDEGKLAFISNVGTLIEPTTKTTLYNGVADIPLGLFSHSDQVMHWQTSVPHDRVATGWGGKIVDLLNSIPNGPDTNPNISMNISLSGSNVFQTGQGSVEFALSPQWGANGMNGYGDEWLQSQLRTEAVDNMVDAQYQDIFKKTYAKTLKTARDGNLQYEAAEANAIPLQTDFNQNSDLSLAFERVAKTINIREELGMKRQIFFIEYGGWDHHDELLIAQGDMLTEVDNALQSFSLAMEELGLSDKVTTFSISEFSRTLISNGNGTDHAWGGNVFAMGGAVNGQNIYGQFPQLALDSSLEIGNGVLIPTTSADEYFAELAMWYNVPSSGLLDIFPNLGNFYSVSSGANPIGFLNI